MSSTYRRNAETRHSSQAVFGKPTNTAGWRQPEVQRQRLEGNQSKPLRHHASACPIPFWKRAQRQRYRRSPTPSASVRHIQAWFTGKLTVALQGPDGLGSLSWESATSSTQPSAREPLRMRGGGVDSQSVWSRSQRGVDPKAGHKGGVSGGSSHPDKALVQSLDDDNEKARH
jgi:hypothetical protein